MSQHPSLKASGGGLITKRNVLKRFERVEILKKHGRWKAGQRVFGLPKTKPEQFCSRSVSSDRSRESYSDFGRGLRLGYRKLPRSSNYTRASPRS